MDPLQNTGAGFDTEPSENEVQPGASLRPSLGDLKQFRINAKRSLSVKKNCLYSLMTRRGCPREVEQLYDELSSLHSSLAQQHLDYINDAILDGEQQTFQSSFMEEPNEEFEAVGVEVCEYLLHRAENSPLHSSKRSTQLRRS